LLELLERLRVLVRFVCRRDLLSGSDAGMLVSRRQMRRPEPSQVSITASEVQLDNQAGETMVRRPKHP
jgi:hypothetical protein